jgi:hypothetical protein
MPTHSLTNSLAAGASLNIIAGAQFEFVNDPSQVEIGQLAEATGMVATCFMGPDLVQQEGPVPIGTANQVPVYPDNFSIRENVDADTRLNITLRNTTAGTIVTKTLVRINGL